MRIAALADIHGNVWALERVLQAIEREEPDEIVFLGDAILRVPAPSETLDLLRSVPHKAVRGNYDWFVIGEFPGQERRFDREPFLPYEVGWTRKQLSADDLAYLEAMPLTFRMFENTPQEVVVCHASPERAFGGIFPPPDRHRWGMSEEKCLEILEGESAPTVLCAHTHAVMEREVGNYRVINPGAVSLGWSHEDKLDGLARWALFEWDSTGGRWKADFRTETYDHRPAWEAYERWELWPMLREYEKPRWWGEKARLFAEADVQATHSHK